MKTIEKIEKEKISLLKFSKREVLDNQESIDKRWEALQRAQALGNLFTDKVRIVFETADEKIYQVQTTIWSVGKEFISLKYGIIIPINSILEVE